MRAMLYDASGHDQEIKGEFDPTDLSEDKLIWIDARTSELSDPRLPKSIARVIGSGANGEFGLFMLDNHYRFCVPTCPASGKLSVATLHFYVGKTWVLTLSEQVQGFLEAYVREDEGETLKGRMTPSALAASLMARHLGSYRDELAAVDTAIDQLDENILRSRETHPLQTLAVLRRRIASLRSALASHRPTIQGLVSPDFSVHVGDIDGQQFEKPRQIFERIEDKVARSREVIVGSFDLYTARVTQDTNQLVKALTLATVIIGVIGAVAGVFGMNFDTPISHTGLPGFLAVTGILIFLSIAIITVGFWQEWL